MEGPRPLRQVGTGKRRRPPRPCPPSVDNNPETCDHRAPSRTWGIFCLELSSLVWPTRTSLETPSSIYYSLGLVDLWDMDFSWVLEVIPSYSFFRFPTSPSPVPTLFLFRTQKDVRLTQVSRVDSWSVTWHLRSYLMSVSDPFSGRKGPLQRRTRGWHREVPTV